MYFPIEIIHVSFPGCTILHLPQKIQPGKSKNPVPKLGQSGKAKCQFFEGGTWVMDRETYFEAKKNPASCRQV